MAIYKLLLTTKTHIRCKGQSLLHILWIINLSIIAYYWDVCVLRVVGIFPVGQNGSIFSSIAE